MPQQFTKRLQQLAADHQYRSLAHIEHGIEKEGLRVTPDSHLSQTDHPSALGSALTHPYITTDFSESLLELVTPVFNKPVDALSFLAELHAVTLQQLPDNETIWPASMPAILQDDDHIPIARYGHSNTGRTKSVYRQGLANRYGKAMQTIAGIHYNVSLGDDFWRYWQEVNGLQQIPLQTIKSDGYFALIRNFHRYSWLLSYLFGASPAVDKSFFMERLTPNLQWLDKDTLFLPWATSLRMSDLGYTSSAQSSLSVDYRSLDNYIQTIRQATRTPYPAYEEIGVRRGSEYQQLNSHLLQIENEFYSTIRPKRVTLPGEKTTEALEQRGVEYIEVRNLDINPLHPVGMNETQALFMDTFLLFNVLHDSPEFSDGEQLRNKQNFSLSVREGRRPGLLLQDGHDQRTLIDWAHELFNKMIPVAELLDKANDTRQYSRSLESEREKLTDVSKTPSARILNQLQQGQSFKAFSAEQSRLFADAFIAQSLSPERKLYYQQLAHRSLLEQQQIEASDQLDFDSYLAQNHSTVNIESAA